jgi:hypothetical protein
LNKQYLKYYVKEVDPTFDETKVDLEKTDIIEDLPFSSKQKRKNFLQEDFPFEVYGCADPMTRNLHTYLNGWVYAVVNKYQSDIGVFALGEEELTIQSTYHYLSKSGTRLRKVIFPENISELWNSFDVIITANKELFKKCPIGKVCVMIDKSDNKCDAEFHYPTLEDLLKDGDFMFNINKSLETAKGKNYFIQKFLRLFNIKNLIRK